MPTISNLDNPFADYGSIVCGPRFIGRADDLRVIVNRIVKPRDPGNLAIIGEARIGKSSLVYQGVMERKDELIALRRLPIWLNLATFDTAPAFFRSLVTSSMDELADQGWLTDAIQQAAERALQDQASWAEGYGRIQRFFERVTKAAVRVIIVLDEFDHARHLLRNDTSGFQGLRELAYRPEWRVTYVTTSRRSIREIELQTHAISTFDGIFHKHYISVFNDTDFKAFLGRLADSGIALSDAIVERIEFYCGRQPYLLEMLGYELVEGFHSNQNLNVDLATQATERGFLDQYDRITALLAEDNTLNKLLRILFGPAFDVTPNDAADLIRYGLIKQSGSGNYLAYSPHFQTYLQVIARQTELWPIWRETETTLRRVITLQMVTLHGNQWIETLEKARPNLKTMFQRCREAQQKEELSFSGRASPNLIDYTYPMDLYALVAGEWNVFRPILGKDKGYWEQRFQLLAKIRNPMAHNRDGLLQDYERQLAEAYCKEILAAVQSKETPLSS